MSSYNLLFCRPSPSRFPRTDEDNVVAFLFDSPNDTPNLAATSGFKFPNDQSQQQQQRQCHPKTSSHSWSPNLLTASSGLENGNAGSGGGGFDYQRQNCRPLVLAVTTVDGEQVFIAEEVGFRRAWPLSTISMPYTNSNGNNGHGLGTITNSHISLTILQQLLTFSSLLTSTSILASNSSFYTTSLSFTATSTFSCWLDIPFFSRSGVTL